MHGHQLRQTAEREHVDRWTDISVGALYGALKRMAGEGLIEEVRTEQVGGYPERSIWGLTDAGRSALTVLRRSALQEIVLPADPVDLALSRLDPERLDDVPEILAARIAALRARLADTEAYNASIDRYLTPIERVMVTHRVAKLRAEVDWHAALLERLPELLADPDSLRESHDS